MMLYPVQIKRDAYRRLAGGDLLKRGLMSGWSDPLVFRLVPPSAKDLRDHSSAAKKFTLSWYSEADLNPELCLIYKDISAGCLGKYKIPCQIKFQNYCDFAKWAGGELFLRGACHCQDVLRCMFGCTDQDWFCSHIKLFLKDLHAFDLAAAAVLALQQHPFPCLGVRAFAIEGLDTKFIEKHVRLTETLADRLLPDEYRDPDAEVFMERYGLKDPSQIRFSCRSADPDQSFRGEPPLQILKIALADLKLDDSDGFKNVLVVENKETFLHQIPRLKKTLVIWGHGYTVKGLARFASFGNTKIFYWGDLDTHGFACLSNFRSGSGSKSRSLLMDLRTLKDQRVQNLFVEENSLYKGKLSELNLTDQECQAYLFLTERKTIGKNRLEQELLPASLVNSELQDAGFEFAV